MQRIRRFAAALLIALLPMQGIGAATLVFCPAEGQASALAQPHHMQHDAGGQHHGHGDVQGAGGGLDHCSFSSAALPVVSPILPNAAAPVMQPASAIFYSLFYPEQPQRVPLLLSA